MKITSEEVLRGLIDIFNINGCRIEVYEKLKSQLFSPEIQKYFQQQVDESTLIIEKLNPILSDSLESAENPTIFKDAKIDQSQFYFGMACASNNPRTVMISCQFGNEFLVKAYQRILQSLDTNALDSLWRIVSKHLESIKNTHMDYEYEVMNNLKFG